MGLVSGEPLESHSIVLILWTSYIIDLGFSEPDCHKSTSLADVNRFRHVCSHGKINRSVLCLGATALPIRSQGYRLCFDDNEQREGKEMAVDRRVHDDEASKPW